ncbi:MAG: ParA family protein [Myxococcales bacterium]|nr:ParA family protein [Myxococcota bacterium]MDW8281411.1 ParA family protein [Myxococcales bacterium]
MLETCTSCGRKFAPQYAYQVAMVPQPGGAPERRFFCHLECRRAALGEAAFSTRRARKLAILNQKGGTGKTTTAVNLAAGLAERGFETLLIDTDAQGNVGASLGVKGDRSLYHVLVEGQDAADVAVPVRGSLDVITADATLAVAEVWLARLDQDRDRILAKRMGSAHRRYQFILLDCGPSLSLLNQNALTYADEVLIPVSCDYLALVGVKQVLKTLKDIERHLGHSVPIAGVLPTFYDARIRLAKEAVATLRGHFKDRLLDPIRRSTRLAEAPSHRQTIFEYDNSSTGAEDYRRLVERIVGSDRPAASSHRMPSAQASEYPRAV